MRPRREANAEPSTQKPKKLKRDQSKVNDAKSEDLEDVLEQANVLLNGVEYDDSNHHQDETVIEDELVTEREPRRARRNSDELAETSRNLLIAIASDNEDLPAVKHKKKSKPSKHHEPSEHKSKKKRHTSINKEQSQSELIKDVSKTELKRVKQKTQEMAQLDKQTLEK